MNAFKLVTKLLILILFSQISFGKSFIDGFYNLSSSDLKIFKLDDDNFIFYGKNGAVLRYNIETEIWTQNYSGTKSKIIKIVKSNETLIALTNNDEILVSEDLSDNWVNFNFDFGLVDVCIVNDIIYLLNIDGQIFKYNLNLNFIEQIFINYNPSKISNNSDYIIINTKDNGYKFYDLNFEKELDVMSIVNYDLKIIDDNLFFYNNDEIIYLVDGEENYEEIPTSISKNYNFTYLDENIYFIDYDIGTLSIVVNKDSETILRTKLDEVNPEYYNIIDVSSINSDLIFTCSGKTIVKTHELDSLELLSHLPVNERPKLKRFINNDLYIFTTTEENVIYSTNGGKTFLPSLNNIQDTIQGVPQFNRIIDIYVDNEGVGYLSTSKSKEGIYSYYTDNNFKNLIPNYDPNTFNCSFLYEDNESVYLEKNKIRDREIQIFKLNKSTKQTDSIFSFKEPDLFGLRLVEKGNKLIGLIDQIVSFDSTSTILFEVNKDWSEYNVLQEFKYSVKIHPESLNIIDGELVFTLIVQDFEQTGNLRFDNYVISQNNQIYPLKDNNYTNLEINSYQNYKVGRILNNDTPVIFREPNTNEYIITNVSFNDQKDSLFYNFIDTLNSNLLIYNLKNDKSDILFNVYNFNELLKPIYSDSLVSKVEYKTEGPPILWLYSPFPNPVVDKLRIRFYSSLIHNIQNLEVQIINIGSGKVYNIDNYDFIPENGFFGFLEFNIAGYLPGAYILNLKLAGESKSELIIIE